MRVLLDTTYLARGHTGTGTYVRELARALRGQIEVVEAANPHRRGPGRGSTRNAAADAWWTRRELPRRARAARADLVHHPLPAHSPGVRNVVTVHDLAFATHPELFDRRYATWARLAHARAARAADAVVAVSHTTANEAMTRWGLPRERVVVAHHGPGQPLRAIERTNAPRHVLYIGDDEPRKNLALLHAAVERFARLPLRRAQPGDDLAELHAQALALVHPAVHEGFGLTALEALAAGTPLVAYPSLAVREVCGPAALYATTADGLADHLRRLDDDEAFRAARGATGRAHAAHFSWEHCARRHVQAYTLALA